MQSTGGRSRGVAQAPGLEVFIIRLDVIGRGDGEFVFLSRKLDGVVLLVEGAVRAFRFPGVPGFMSLVRDLRGVVEGGSLLRASRAGEEAAREHKIEDPAAEGKAGHDDGDADFDDGPYLRVVVGKCDVFEVDLHDGGDTDDTHHDVTGDLISGIQQRGLR